MDFLNLPLSFITAFAITFLAIPSIINVAIKKNLFDEPDERKKHKTKVPTLGGLGIFAGVFFSFIFFSDLSAMPEMQYIMASILIMFLIGAKDDIVPLSPSKKFAGQVIAAFILVVFGGVKITSLYGLFGIFDIPDPFAISLSIFTIIVIINSFNLIDGIDGLTGTIGSIISVTFAAWFYCIDQYQYAILALTMTGSLLAFLRFNIAPARIFMGDTGSLLVGLVSAILAIKFIEINNVVSGEFHISSVPAVCIGILIIPLFDTLRVFIVRIIRGRSPFHPDRNHIHHLLIDLGLNHTEAVTLLVITNLVIISMVFALQDILSTLALLILLGSIATSLSLILIYKRRQLADAKKPEQRV